jgi:DNA polymerase III epsilon subunit-like protein
MSLGSEREEILVSYFETMKQRVILEGVMVDVEAAGRAPSVYPLLSLGATLIGDPTQRFYVELIPDKDTFDPQALRSIGHTDLSYFKKHGLPPVEAMTGFRQWVIPFGFKSPLFVAHNAAFDWMFYLCYMFQYGVENPFGHKPFDTASAYGNIMTTPIPHHAGEDSYIQTLDLRRFYGL